MERAAWPHEEDTGRRGLGETQRTPRGRPAPQHPQPRREISRGACLGGETSPGSCHWKPLFLAARGGAAPPQLVLITLTGSRACCGGAPSPPQSRPGRQTSPHFPLPARLGCAWGGCADRDSTPPPPHSPHDSPFSPCLAKLWRVYSGEEDCPDARLAMLL